MSESSRYVLIVRCMRWLGHVCWITECVITTTLELFSYKAGQPQPFMEQSNIEETRCCDKTLGMNGASDRIDGVNSFI